MTPALDVIHQTLITDCTYCTVTEEGSSHEQFVHTLYMKSNAL